LTFFARSHDVGKQTLPRSREVIQAFLRLMPIG
jgi:hypothetical protein